MFKALSALVLTAAFAGSWLVTPPCASPALVPSPVGPGGILEMHRQLFAAMDRGDVDVVKALVDDERKHGESQGSVFIPDASGAPAEAWGSSAARELLAHVVAEDKKSGGEWKTTITRSVADCPSGELSFAVLEFERAHVVDGKADVKKYVSTSLVRFDDGRWRLFHWHVSPATRSESVIAKR